MSPLNARHISALSDGMELYRDSIWVNPTDLCIYLDVL